MDTSMVRQVTLDARVARMGGGSWKHGVTCFNNKVAVWGTHVQRSTTGLTLVMSINVMF